MAKTCSSAPCYARLTGDQLTLGNDLFERRWRLQRGLLLSESFLDKRCGASHFVGLAPSPCLWMGEACDGEPALEVRHLDGRPVGQPRLHARLQWGASLFVFDLYPRSAGARVRLARPPAPPIAAGVSPQSAEPTGIEQDPAIAKGSVPPDVIECFRIAPLHRRVVEVTLQDRTDWHDNLVSERAWLLSPANGELSLVGNIQWIENSLTGQGVILLKEAPLPHARPLRTELPDLLIRSDGVCCALGNGIGAGATEGYGLVTLAYCGGAAGRIAALQQWQRNVRDIQQGRDGLLLSNTWGDRSRDARINETFIRAEIAAGSRLGVEVVQIDDGWQVGRTANSATPGGVWNGFWQANPRFWEPSPERFPTGLASIASEAESSGMGLGLWYAPDSSDDFSNWERDAHMLLRLHSEFGVRHIKIDGVKATSKLGEQRLRAMFEKVLQQSAGQVTFDFDVTAETRPGYFGLIDVGPIFVENRYTDWHRYWPHRTLRNLWMLAHYVDPVRLRMEFLNHTRNAEKYESDPLAPRHYEPAALFAMVMIASPLGWFETSNLPPDYIAEVGQLVRLWKAHREDLHGGTIIPVGDEPCGAAWCGFVSVSAASNCAHVLAFRQLTQHASHLFAWPNETLRPEAVEILAGTAGAEASVSDVGIRLTVPRPLGFVWARVTLPPPVRTIRSDVSRPE
jgi:alpha-galactosidase